MMQALMPVFAILGVAAGAQLTLLPYAYLADPLPVYHQLQDTRAGVHAYSYAGGPSAKEEARGRDGVTRGSYSYVDPHGILQSVFYVADEGGFRVAATNLPGDGDLPYGTGEILLARNAHLLQHAKAAAQQEKKQVAKQEEEEEEEEDDLLQLVHTTGRRKRSLEASADQDHPHAENPSSHADQAGQDSFVANYSPQLTNSHELLGSERTAVKPVILPVYDGLLHSVLIPRLTGTATSHQSRVDIHNNVKVIQPFGTIEEEVLAEPAYKTLLLPARLPLVTSHQSHLQVHDNLHVETPEGNMKVAQSQAPAVATVKLQSLPVIEALRDYNENRIQLHKALGLEGPNRKDTVKIDGAQVAALKETLPIVSSVSSQSRAQIHRNAGLEVAVPIASQPSVFVAASYAQPIASWPIYAPIAQSSQYRSQIHSSEKIELAK